VTEGRVVADLVDIQGDFPWLGATVVPHDGYERIRPLFEAELAALKRTERSKADPIDPDAEAAWARAYEAIRAACILVDSDGQPIPEFLMHIDGDVAEWRWSDRVFEPELEC